LAYFSGLKGRRKLDGMGIGVDFAFHKKLGVARFCSPANTHAI
jgi:hypothetical protein